MPYKNLTAEDAEFAEKWRRLIIIMIFAISTNSEVKLKSPGKRKKYLWINILRYREFKDSCLRDISNFYSASAPVLGGVLGDLKSEDSIVAICRRKVLFLRQFRWASWRRLHWKIKIRFAFQDVIHGNTEMVVFNASLQRWRIAAPFDFIDSYRSKSPTAIAADHIISVLIVSFPFRPADITSIKGGPQNPVRTFQDKIIVPGFIYSSFCQIWKH